MPGSDRNLPQCVVIPLERDSVLTDQGPASPGEEAMSNLRRILLLVVTFCGSPSLSAHLASAQGSPPEEKQVVVVAAKVEDLAEDHYMWGAEVAAARLKGKTTVVEGGLAGALRHVRENVGLARGIIEIMIDVHSWNEEVRITCFDTAGRVLWKEKAKANMGGNEEKLARNMLERALKKAEKRKACGS